MKKPLVKRACLLLLALVLLVLAVPSTRAMAVMSVYSALEARRSVLSEAGISLKLPGGASTAKKDWFPFVITFNADYFGAYVNRPADLSILYNFGAFNPAAGCSSLYDPKSDYHGAFYGAYAVQSHDVSVFGYTEEDALNTEEMALVFKYDEKELVLKSFGCEDPEFSYALTGEGKITIDGKTFDVINAKISTNSPLHTVQHIRPAYLQYGAPKKTNVEKDFKKLTVYGRIYAMALPEKNITLCLYIIAPNLRTINACEADMIEKAKICID